MAGHPYFATSFLETCFVCPRITGCSETSGIQEKGERMDHSFPPPANGMFMPYAPLGMDAGVADDANLQIFRAFHGQRPDSIPDDLFRLRYEVYCMECAYLKADAALGGHERDDYDHCSTHFAAYTLDEALVGTVRLVTPAVHRAYPFELHCPTFPDFHMPPRTSCGEVSRLAVRRSHRRRRADSVQGVPGFSPQRQADHDPGARGDRRGAPSPMLLLGMYREMYRHSRALGIRYWFAAMERSLAHSLRRMGFSFDAIGPTADYYGKVTPYVLDLGELLPVLRVNNPPLLAWFDEVPRN
jgi:N-acyl amino acid synthase of PEP-CTERM/exosortase system